MTSNGVALLHSDIRNIHGLGASWLNVAVNYAQGYGIVSLDGCLGLRMSHFDERVSRWDGVDATAS